MREKFSIARNGLFLTSGQADTHALYLPLRGRRVPTFVILFSH
jgi:hypothetical protein